MNNGRSGIRFRPAGPRPQTDQPIDTDSGFLACSIANVQPHHCPKGTVEVMRRIVQRKSVRSILLVLAVMAAVLAPQAPAHAAWGTQTPLNYTLAVSGGNPYQLLTYVDGNWIQWDTGGEKVRLSINHCRQSSYVIPDIKVFINGTYKGTLYGPSSGCKTHTPTYDFG